MKIFIYGPPGSGKSTVGEALAKDLSLQHIDVDKVFEGNYGSISEYIKCHGVESFREMETKTLDNIISTCACIGFIISLGGGTLLRLKNVQVINNTQGKIVTLMGSWNLMFQRIQNDMHNKRPLSENREDFMRLMEERILHYQSFYPRIPIDGKNAPQIANDIKGIL